MEIENEKLIAVKTALSNLAGFKSILLEGYSKQSNYYMQVSAATASLQQVMEHYIEVNENEENEENENERKE